MSDAKRRLKDAGQSYSTSGLHRCTHCPTQPTLSLETLESRKKQGQEQCVQKKKLSGGATARVALCSSEACWKFG